jgi:hypothetical protein
MSVTIKVQVKGVEELANLLQEKLPSALDEYVSNSMQGVGILMQYDAQLRAPKKTGYMASQITFEMLPYHQWAFRLIGRAPYTLYQEFGTRYIAPRMFMTQALQTYRDQMVSAVRDGVSHAISDVFV